MFAKVDLGLPFDEDDWAALKISPEEQARRQEAPDALPAGFAVHQPYPNPGRGVFTVRYQLPAEAELQFSLYDESGGLWRAVPAVVKAAGAHAYILRIGDLPAGMYRLRCAVRNTESGESGTATRTLLLLK